MPAHLKLFAVFLLWWIAVIPITLGAAFFGAWMQRLAMMTRDTDALYGDSWLSNETALQIYDVRCRLCDILERDGVQIGGAIVPGAEDYVIRVVWEASDGGRAGALRG